MVATAQTTDAPTPPDEVWDADERSAWSPPASPKPSEWSELHIRLLRGRHRGPYRNDNAPYLRGVMDILDTPGVVQGNVEKGVQLGVSTAARNMLGCWGHTSPDPVGLTLPDRQKGRTIVKKDVRPLFRHTKVLRDLIGSTSRDTTLESISLLNGFELDLMWSGSATSMASNPYRRVINDEVDKFQPWTGEEPDAIAATEVRLTSYGDQRLQFNISTPTTTALTIHQLFKNSTVQLFFYVPCPHCRKHQQLVWKQVRWLDAELADESIASAEAALAAGELSYIAGESPVHFMHRDELAEEIKWLRSYRQKLSQVDDRRDLAALVAAERDRAVWYQCSSCQHRVYDSQKAAMVRKGRWSTVDGYVVDYWGKRHVDAETVERWPNETRIGMRVSSLYCLWMHWSTLAGEWLRAQNDPKALFAFITQRLAEPFEFRSKRTKENLYADKCTSARGALAAGIVPSWAWLLLATVDTQQDHFYLVVRAWGGAMRSARVYHGKLMTFDELDRLLFATQWPVEGDQFAPMTISRTLIDSGGTVDRLLGASRTQEVYNYTLGRQPIVTAIKGASRPGAGLYWPMKNPMAEGGKADFSSLRALMVDTHRANDLLSEMVVRGIPRAGGRGDGRPVSPESWLLNQANDPEYNTHMAAVQKTVDPKTRNEYWTPRATGARHDYRDCEAYQVIAAYLANVHLLPEPSVVMEWKQQQVAQLGRKQPAAADDSNNEAWTPQPL